MSDPIRPYEPLIPMGRTIDSIVNWCDAASRGWQSLTAEAMGTAMTIAITRLDLSAADLREAAARTEDAKAARRMLAIGLVLEDWSREAAAEACAMDRQTLRDWVHRYNTLGLAGCPTGRAATAHGLACRANSGPRWRNGSSRARSTSGTVWCAGAVSICNCGSRRSLASRCTSARWASCCARCRSGGCRCVRSIP